jgi:hypothetical protein
MPKLTAPRNMTLSRIDEYRAECAHFSQKYGTTRKEFEDSLRAKKGSEDFEKEKDLDDWEFAEAALRWWSEKKDDPVIT